MHPKRASHNLASIVKNESLSFSYQARNKNHEHKCHIKTNLQFISQSIAKSFVLFNFHVLIALFHLSRVSFAPPYHHISRTRVKGENWFYDFWEPPVKGQDWFLKSFFENLQSKGLDTNLNPIHIPVNSFFEETQRTTQDW